MKFYHALLIGGLSTRALIPDHHLQTLADASGQSLWYAFLAGLVIVGLDLGLSFFMADLTPAAPPRPGHNSHI
ncbi:MAG: hypothetical protein V3U27_00445 [Candidatus Tectomicrobia bacterium]